MREAIGHVSVNEKDPSRRFQRFVDEKMRNWLRNHRLDDDSTEFEVAFFDEEPIGETSCLIVVQSGPHLWRSWETADNPRVALRRSLDNLKDDSKSERGENKNGIDKRPSNLQ